MHRKDRTDKRGGGVLIAVRNTITSTHDTTLDVDAEVLWCSIKLQNQKSMAIGAFYRPPNTGAEVLDQLQISLSKFADNCKKTIILAGEFNLPDIDWTIPIIKTACRKPVLHQQLITLLDDYSLTQTNRFETRGNNILDLVVTNSPNLINRTEIIPGISDHHAIFTEVNAIQLVNKKQQRTIYLHKRTNTEAFKSHLIRFSKVFAEQYAQTATVNDMWAAFKAAINDGMTKYVPTKTLKHNDHLPWINRNIKCLIKKRNKAFATMKNQPLPDNIANFKTIKRKVQLVIRQTYQEYLMDIINPTVDCGNKKLWSLIKATRRDATGVAPLKHNGALIQDPLDKANTLNEQFKSAFSPSTTTTLPDMGESPYAQMPNITISTAGVQKLLLGLNTHKAAGPDAILPRTLKDCN